LEGRNLSYIFATPFQTFAWDGGKYATNARWGLAMSASVVLIGDRNAGGRPWP
jgi:hypothetical protein